MSPEVIELLNIAAKAAGVGPIISSGEYGLICEQQGIRTTWNPLRFDSDALRLAVTLNMRCEFGNGFVLVEATDGAGPCYEKCDYRLAIVRAAAEIGRNIP